MSNVHVLIVTHLNNNVAVPLNDQAQMLSTAQVYQNATLW